MKISHTKRIVYVKGFDSSNQIKEANTIACNLGYTVVILL